MKYPQYNDIGIEKHRIASYQIDLKGQATLPVICNLFQEIAGNHAGFNGFGFFDMLKGQKMWVLTRLRIEVDKYPTWNDEIYVQTWVKFRKNKFTEREFILYDKDMNKLAGGRSGWMLIDIKTKLPASVEQFPISIRMFPDKHAVDNPLKKLRSVEDSHFTYERTAEFQDIDVNQHVNNVKYIEWFLSSFPYQHRKTNNVKNFEINFLAEMTYDKSADIVSEQISDNLYLSGIIEKETKKEICRAEIEWVGIA
jgi:acyl-ACP thioesterase